MSTYKWHGVAFRAHWKQQKNKIKKDIEESLMWKLYVGRNKSFILRKWCAVWCPMLIHYKVLIHVMNTPKGQLKTPLHVYFRNRMRPKMRSCTFSLLERQGWPAPRPPDHFPCAVTFFFLLHAQFKHARLLAKQSSFPSLILRPPLSWQKTFWWIKSNSLG